MAEHQELVMEIGMVEKMATGDRLKHAKKRRIQQIKKFVQYEKQLDKDLKKNKKNQNNNKKMAKKKKVTRVHFVSNIMLLEAAARNDIHEVRQLLEKKVTPDVTNEDGLTALHQCCIDDYEEMMKLLIEFGANANARDSELWTPLHAAATCGHVHLCKYLIDNGAELLAVNADGNMPYDICEDELTLDFIESEMAKRGVTQELIDDTRLSSEKNMLNDLKTLAASGEDLEFRDRNGATPLHIAAANGYIQVAEFLLEQRVTMDVVDHDQWQPIHAAACWGHPQILEILVQHGADLEARTKTGETPVDLCEDPELKERLVEIKEELASSRPSHVSDHRPTRRHSSTRSGMSASTGSLYNSNTSLSGNPFSASVRRTSMREKSAISRKEARDEATLRHSAASDEEEEDDGSDEVATSGLGLQGHQMNGDPVPTSNIDDISVNMTESDTKSEREEPSPPPPVLAPTESKHVPSALKQSQQSARSATPPAEKKPPPTLPTQDIWIPDKGSDRASDKNSDLTNSSLHTDHRAGPALTRGAGTNVAPPSGTLADLKKQRSQQLQNSLRYRDTKFLNLDEQNHAPADTNGGSVVPQSERNGHSPSLSNNRNNNMYRQGEAPKHRFTATQASEIVGADEEKENCCVIL